MLIIPISTEHYDLLSLFWEELNSLLCCGFIKTGISERRQGTKHTPGSNKIEAWGHVNNQFLSSEMS